VEGSRRLERLKNPYTSSAVAASGAARVKADLERRSLPCRWRRRPRAGALERDRPVVALDSIVSVPRKHGMYAGPWLAAMIGAENRTGPLVAQTCATGARSLAVAAELEVAGGANPATCRSASA
jgi:hypothetical protein